MGSVARRLRWDSFPPATDLAGGRSPNVVGDHRSRSRKGVLKKVWARLHNGTPHHTHLTSSVVIWIGSEGVCECWCRVSVNSLRGLFGSRLFALLSLPATVPCAFLQIKCRFLRVLAAQLCNQSERTLFCFVYRQRFGILIPLFLFP